MSIFKQKRWIMPLLGIVLACLSVIIFLFLPIRGEERGRGDNSRLPRLSSARVSGSIAVKVDNRTRPPSEEPGIVSGSVIAGPDRPKLPVVCRSPRLGWKPLPAAEWLSAKSWNRKIQSLSPSMTAKGVTSVSVIRLPQNVEHRKETARAAEKANIKQAALSKPHPPAILYFSRTKLLGREERSQATRSYEVAEEEVLLLSKIVMAEAEGEPYEGKVAVANVVLNRLRSANFPDTIKEVIYQKFQFSPVANGRLNRIHPNQDSVRAVHDALSGVKEVSDDTYYFLSLKLAQDLTVHHSRTFSEKIGNHSFYR